MTRRLSRRALVTGLPTAVAIVAVGGFLLIRSVGLYVAPIDEYRRTEDDRTIVMTALLLMGDSLVTYWVSEDRNSVAITVLARRSAEASEAIGIPHQIRVMLRESIGVRRVLDSQGRSIPERR